VNKLKTNRLAFRQQVNYNDSATKLVGEFSANFAVTVL
jgi:hypothetical protein